MILLRQRREPEHDLNRASGCAALCPLGPTPAVIGAEPGPRKGSAPVSQTPGLQVKLICESDSALLRFPPCAAFTGRLRAEEGRVIDGKEESWTLVRFKLWRVKRAKSDGGFRR